MGATGASVPAAGAPARVKGLGFDFSEIVVSVVLATPALLMSQLLFAVAAVEPDTCSEFRIGMSRGDGGLYRAAVALPGTAEVFCSTDRSVVLIDGVATAVTLAVAVVVFGVDI